MSGRPALVGKLLPLQDIAPPVVADESMAKLNKFAGRADTDVSP